MRHSEEQKRVEECPEEGGEQSEEEEERRHLAQDLKGGVRDVTCAMTHRNVSSVHKEENEKIGRQKTERVVEGDGVTCVDHVFRHFIPFLLF